MDVAVIDWTDSKFEKDLLYEDFNAPQWIDFSNPPLVHDDDAWFCRPDYNHPKTVEDFFRERSPASSKLQISAGGSQILRSGDRNRRDAALKKRGIPLNKDSKYIQDDENQNPNFSTPPVNKAKSNKEMIKSSAEKGHLENIPLEKEEAPKLSAQSVFTGRDILNQVTEFCNELKRLAIIRTKEMGALKESQSQREPLQEKSKGIENHNNDKQKLTKKITNEESENSPITLNMKNIRNKDEQRLLQIRTNPPSPQCFSAKHKATPPKASGLRPQERGILEGISSSSSSSKEVKGRNTSQSQTALLSKQNEAKGLDVFWFLKPCTLSR
ncbi:uncharacterized protein LOC143608919 [Bidens hawaiensis]|uniref:uncharacterized protein LOC143608919 n=1 Tax=Bidens hawaiensis TaxID=980011 RepID=UPI004049A617